MDLEFLTTYEEINKIYLDNLINKNNRGVDSYLIEKMNKFDINYSLDKENDIFKYSIKPTLSEFERLIETNKVNLSTISDDDIDFLHKIIKEKIHYYKIDKHQNLDFSLFDSIKKNELFIKYKDNIFFHFNIDIKGFRTVYLPISNECHIIGKYEETLKHAIFIFHELGHCFQLLSNNKIYPDYALSEFFACSNEILMSKSLSIYDNVLKLISNKILESICTYDFYQYLYSLSFFDEDKIEKKWKELCQTYNIVYKKQKWLRDLNSIEKPQNIISYTIAYLACFIFIHYDYVDFIKICDNSFSIDSLLNIIKKNVNNLF